MRCASIIASLAVASSAAAEGTQWGVQTGARASTGAMADRYGVGFVLGFQSTLMPSWIGLSWSVQYTWFWDRSDPRNVDTLQLIDLDLGVRVQAGLGGSLPILLWGQLGAGLLRASVPLEGDKTSYIGPTAGLGAELVMWSPLVLSLGADYSYLGSGGPSGVRILLAVSLSSR